MPRVPPFDRAATYDDLVRVPDIMVAEIVDGELHATPRPAMPHAHAASALGGLLVPPFWRGQEGPGGWWILDEPELHFGADVVVPDLAGWRRSRLPAVPDLPFLTLAPDWICEVLSPATVDFVRGPKLGVYGRAGVAHAWLIDPVGRSLEVLEFRSGRWTALAAHVGSQAVRAVPFDAIDLPLGVLWGQLD